MASGYQLILNGTAADDALYEALTGLEVEENADLPGAFQFSLPVNRADDGNLTYATDPRFAPYSTIAVVTSLDGQDDECIFDGVLLSGKLHLETGVANSSLELWGQDYSWMMNVEEKVVEWTGTEVDTAASIFGNYGIQPAPDNSNDDSPTHTEDGHTLMQRQTDIQFLRGLARRNGRLCRVYAQSTPGDRIGYFARPDLTADPVATLNCTDPANWTVNALDIEWDVTRPTIVNAGQALFTDSDPNSATVSQTDSGLAPLDANDLSTFAGQDNTVILTTTVDDSGELTDRAQAVLIEAGWFVRCEGETDANHLNAILRVGDIVAIEGIGSLHSGNYFVWSVRHTIDKVAHKMKFVLVRNAVGQNDLSGGGLLGSVGL